MLKRFSLFTLLLAILALVACQTAGPTAAPVDPSAPQLTDVAGTIAAQLTDAAAANPTAAPTDTQAPPPTDTPAPEPTAAEPPTDTPVFVLPTVDTPEAPVPESPATSTITATPVMTPTVDDPDVGGGRIITGTLPALTSTVQEPAATPGAGTPGPATAVPANFRTVYEDDFSSPVYWPVEREDTWSLRFAQGGYVITADFRGDFAWGVKSDTYEDVRVEVDASRLAGPSSSYFGVICRHQNGSNYYALMMAADGTYGIAKKSAGSIEWLVQSDMQSPAILTGNEVNRLRAECIGNTLSLYVNNQFVASADDSEFVSGAVGVGAGNRYQDGIEALFDNIVISVPQ